MSSSVQIFGYPWHTSEMWGVSSEGGNLHDDSHVISSVKAVDIAFNCLYIVLSSAAKVCVGTVLIIENLNPASLKFIMLGSGPGW